MKYTVRRFLLFFILLALPLCACLPSSSAANTGSGYGEVTAELVALVDNDAELKKLLETAIDKAAAEVTDRDMNPVDSLTSLYEFLDRSAKAMPWDICPSGRFTSLYDRIDQAMGCFYFIFDQPLEELADKGYYHNSIMYHEPISTWLAEYIREYGQFLNTEGSWNDTYLKTAQENPEFGLAEGSYEDPNNWKSFNDFFARKLADPSKRSVASPEDDSVVISPADSSPQGVWQINADSNVLTEDPADTHGIVIKTGSLTNVSALLSGSKYAEAFAGGTLTHTFLDVHNYHHYHFPVSGTILEVLQIPQNDAPGGVIVYDKEQQRYKEYFSESVGWQSIETRGVVIIQMDSGALAAVVPVGMCQVSSVNFENTVIPGAHFKKGDPLGYFLFGGSDIIMLFSEDAGFTLTAEALVPIKACEEYGTLK